MGLDLQEVLVLHRFRTNQGHVVGAGVVVLGIEAGRVCEVAVLAAEACRLRIHHVGEGLAGPRHMAGECIAALIRGFQQQRVETVPYRQDITLFDLGIRRPGVNIVHVIMAEGDLLVEVTVLQHYECGQDLRDRRRCHLFVHVLLEQDRPGVRVEDDAGARGKLRVREVPRGVRAHREERRPQGTYEKGHEDGSARSAPSPVMMMNHEIYFLFASRSRHSRDGACHTISIFLIRRPMSTLAFGAEVFSYQVPRSVLPFRRGRSGRRR